MRTWGRKNGLPQPACGLVVAMTGEGTSSIVPRKPPSLVQKWGIQWGRSPLGREEGSRGTFMEWFPGRVFAFFRRAAKEGRSRRSETTLVQTLVPAAAGKIGSPERGAGSGHPASHGSRMTERLSPPQRAILRASADSPLVSVILFPVPSPPAGFFL